MKIKIVNGEALFWGTIIVSCVIGTIFESIYGWLFLGVVLIICSVMKDTR